MQFTEKEAVDVKTWVVKKLEDISDADSDVLADYVLALIRSDAPDAEIRRASIENLEDFLKENTTKFVDEIFDKYNPKPQSSAPQSVPQQPSLPPVSQPSPFPQPIASAAVAPVTPFGHGQPFGSAPPTRPGHMATDGPNTSRKRSYGEGPQGGDEQDHHYNRGNRPFKTPRGAGRGRGDRMMSGRGGQGGMSQPNQPTFPHQPTGFSVPPPGFPPFDPNDPMAAMMALQAMGFPQLPGMPPMPQMPTPMPTSISTPGRNTSGSPPAVIPQRCRDYDTQGFCVLGSTCPYQHGPDHIIAPSSKDDEYDPTKSNIVTDRPQNGTNGTPRGGDRGRGRGRGGRGDRGDFQSRGRGRAEFSQAGPNDDQSITTIVVEQIPEDKFDEQIVRDFFSEFGNIVDITLKPYKHLALVKYDNYPAAKRAWSSPKVIFDNRFVKVYWHKPGARGEANGSHPHSQQQQGAAAETPFDKEAFEKQQAEAQKVHEEKIKKRREAEEARAALEKQRDELLKRQQEEKAKLLERLGSGSGGGKASTDAETDASGQPSTDDANGPASGDGGDDNASEQTKALRAQLAALEAEAKSLGLDPNASGNPPFHGRGRGAGGYRGGFVPRGGRGGYDPSFRGGYYRGGRGGGTPRGAGGAGRGGVLRLDNRPKRVAVSGVEFDATRDEALRQFLVGVGEYESIEPNPDRPDSLIVSFKDRYMAEQLMFGTPDIPSIGKVQYSWVANLPSSNASTPMADGGGGASGGLGNGEGEGVGGDTVMGGQDDLLRKDGGGGIGVGGGAAAVHEVDYDVAEVDDWAIE
ncbi:hypothetical protein AJ80_04510 [Polytolypa hystricis UAMH7299]|uniref:C3H1-type domain-containing protein n=1 Tax=Polytolypa hystricis (strain UAMH7299) TaxID=1447883 RepID=A0A2B7YBT8_POLH7|nr:hypothetical protein AJ80_04510 [Polytolypa hystricis UAMH7299]